MDEIDTGGRIVVGVDGSAGSRAALHWALRQATLTGGALHVVHAIRYVETYEWTASPTNYGTVPAPLKLEPAEVRVGAERALHEQLRHASAGHEDFRSVAVTTELANGHPSDALLAAAKDAELLVLGRTGHGGFAGMLLGSVARRCVEHSTCGVVIIPAPADLTST